MDEFMSPLNDSNATSGTPSSNGRGRTSVSATSTYRKRKRSTNIGFNIPEGQKLVIPTNQELQPNENHEVTVMFSTKVGVIARRDIPISYKDWRKIDPTIIRDAVKCLGKYFEFDYQESIDTEYTRDKLNSCWRTYKHDLYRDFVQDENPSIVREAIPEGHSILLEDWQRFVDYCNSDEFKVKSERNKKNREKNRMPSCTGRRSAAVVRHMMAVERGVADHEIGRSESYLVMHTRKNNVPQDPELVEDVNRYMTICPQSRATGVYDALVMATAPDGRGRFRGMGPRMCKTRIRMTDPLLRKNAKLMEEKMELENKITDMDARIEEQKEVVAELRSLILRQGRTPMSNVDSPHSQSFGHDVVSENAWLGKECNLRVGFPFRTVANGIVQAVDPHLEFGGMRLGEDNCKVFVTVIYEPDMRLPFPHNEYYSTLGELGQGSIIWPKEALQLKN